MKKLILLLLIMSIMSLPTAMANPIACAWPHGEDCLVDIYNSYCIENEADWYGSNDEMWEAVGVPVEVGMATQMWVEILSQQAGFAQRFGWYDTALPDTLNTIFDFDAPVGSTAHVVLGDGINPVLFGLFNTAPEGGKTYYSQIARNEGSGNPAINPLDPDLLPYGNLRMVVLRCPNVPGKYLLGFEDGNDWDYQDNVIAVRLTTDPIPEPTTMALLGMGIAGIALRRRFLS